jgi:hypothetical protein
MRIRPKTLRRNEDYRLALRRDGWMIQGAETAEEFDAIHPEVLDERAARVRLHRLGLLTCPFLQIDFTPQIGKTRLFVRLAKVQFAACRSALGRSHVLLGPRHRQRPWSQCLRLQ